MSDIIYVDRLTGKKQIEKVYKGAVIRFLYGDSKLSRLIQPFLLPPLAKWPFISHCYGLLQKRPSSVKKILPFIKNFDVNISEFLMPLTHFKSFNDFFIRRLKPEFRPIALGEKIVSMPADGRYYFYQDIDQVDGFIVKGKKFSLASLLENKELAQKYQGGSMVIVRLCPSDYHRFHFPCDCIPGETRLLNGYLYSVNPLAIKKNLNIFTQNKRTICELATTHFGKILYLEIGATNVGSIQQTYCPFQPALKGDEKGYFEFGGSSLILLFQKGRIRFDQDLLDATQSGYEIRCLMGQQMGTLIQKF
ncbi:phosphatidylserine decarboxylase [Candidatus Protochlamydia amoebophila]|uniref:Phosphatidylserine decarboxylase proenzyme n=1 Tax=Protochlamydia amoebophila (strain UWE25) TaxID=264201 RepID=Q6MFA2_PARUW|nr:phosphatidylserine decarboxylase [Candidatus Protochlamydia amoebophila]CAF22747.1 unnamed protein product [Candidatus Protochlamydia amoebophila UWE25]